MLLCAAAALGGCERDGVQDITGSVPASRIRFFNFGVNSPGVNFYANETKMTATSSATGVESVVGVNYGGVGSAGLYSGIEPGQYTFSGRISDTIPKANKDFAISTVPATIEAGKHYSFYQSGIYNTATRTVDGFVVEDAFPAAIDYGTVYIRFVNAIHNSSPMTLYLKHTVTGEEVAIGGPVAYKSGGAFIAIPGGTYSLTTRTTGSSTSAITRPDAISFVPSRVYTISSRGDMTVTGTTATNRPFLDNTANR